MRKITLSKLENDKGKETARIYKDDILAKTIDIVPGWKGDLFMENGILRFENIKVVIETIRLDENNRSQFYIHCEWIVGD
jgi:hypothetical protein